MRDDIHEIGYADMSQILRSLICYEPNGAMNVEQPQVLIDQVRRDTPVVRWEMGIGFFSMADVVAAARHPAMRSTEPNSGEAMGMGSVDPLIPLHIDGDLHKHYRKLLDPLFAPRRMALLETSIRGLVDELIDGFIAEGHADLHSAICVPLPTTVFLNLFGLPLEDAVFLNEKKNRILKNEGTNMGEMEVIGRAAGAEMDDHLRMRLAQRRAELERHDDLLDSFLHFEVDGHSLTDHDIVNLMHMFTIAGLDTVTSSLSCLFAWFAKHPEQRRDIVAHPERLGGAIEELMRYESPVPSGGVRFVVEDGEVNGVPIRKGDMAYLCWASANLDPASCSNPLDVDLVRENNTHIAFAAGLHRCLGSHLARAEMRAAIDQFHSRISDYWITEGDDAEYEFAGVRQAKRVPVSFVAKA